MPWTPSHAAAILPFRRLCPKYLSFPALVAGAVAPDMAYYVGRSDISDFAHTLVGSIVVCIPTGLLSLLIFFAMRRPLWFLLPQPHRGAVAPLVAKRQAMDGPAILSATASIVIGAWTHVTWDAFTHSKTWIVDRVDLLREPWLRLGSIEVHGFTVLQDLSTLVGAGLLSMAYLEWLRKQPQPIADNAGSDGWRYCALLGALLASAGIAISMALDATAAAQAPMRVVVVQAAFYAGSAFALLLLAYSTLYFLLRNKG
jgi:hypothetical protein